MHENKSTPTYTRGMTRRQFLAGATAWLVGSALAACGMSQTEPSSEQGFVAPQALQSPMPARPGTPTVTPPPGGLSVTEFLALSALLTGFNNLNPTIGAVYLNQLQGQATSGVTVADLYQRAGFRSPAPPQTLDAMTQTGIFDDEKTRDLADQIIEMWYSGVIQQGEEAQVVTFVDSLAWRAVSYTKPQTICGPYPGFWADRPPTLFEAR